MSRRTSTAYTMLAERRAVKVGRVCFSRFKDSNEDWQK